MVFGYSLWLLELNKGADTKCIGVRLGRECIGRNISVATVAKKFKVSRQTVYNWFSGKVEPSDLRHAAIQTYIDKL